MKRNLSLVIVIFLLLSLHSGLNGAAAAVEAELGKWTGKHTRVVWVQDQGDGADTFARTTNLMLYGYDSKDGRGERALLNQRSNFFKPLITPNGKQVIYSNRQKREIYLLDWESGESKKLTTGVAVAVWEDTEPSFLLRKKRIWVYCFDGLQPENKYGTGQPMYRFLLNKPQKKELVWNKTNLAWSSIQLSRDGQVIGGLFPWPHGGILLSETKEFKRFGRGCWTSLSPDNSKLLWIFDGLHRNIQVHDVNSGENWKVNINSAPGINGFEVYHPRWSNHPRYFALTGPYEKGEGGNKIAGGGEKVEIHIGRFDQKAESVEDWFQVTHNTKADFYPDLWLEGGNETDLSEKIAEVVTEPVKKEWPAAKGNLVFVWENMKGSNQLDENSPVGFYQCNVELRGNALFSRNFQLLADGGWGDTGDAGKKIFEALKKSGKATLEITVEPSRLQTGPLLSFAGKENIGLQILQKGGDLVLQIGDKTVTWKSVFESKSHKSYSLTLNGQVAELYVDGKSQGSQEITFSPGISGQDHFQHLYLADKEGNWHGTIENISVYSRVLNSLAVERNFQATAGRSQPAPEQSLQPLQVEAELMESSEIPSPDAIGAYRRALVINSYQVKKVVEGEYAEEKILVAEWAILDRKIIKEYKSSPVSEMLRLESFAQHPELEGERQLMDIFEPDLELYYRLDRPQ